MQSSHDLREHTRVLAVPTLRTLLRQRRNAIRQSKAILLHEITTRLRRALRSCVALGIPESELAAKLGKEWANIAHVYAIELEAKRVRETWGKGAK